MRQKITDAGAKMGGWLDSFVGCPVHACTSAYRIDVIVKVASSRHNVLSALACLSPGELIRAMKEDPSPQGVLDYTSSLSWLNPEPRASACESSVSSHSCAPALWQHYTLTSAHAA